MQNKAFFLSRIVGKWLLLAMLCSTAVQAQTVHEQLRDDVQSLALLALGSPEQPPRLQGTHGALVAKALSDERLLALMAQASNPASPNAHKNADVFTDYSDSFKVVQRRYVLAFRADPFRYGMEYVSVMNVSLVMASQGLRAPAPTAQDLAKATPEERQIIAAAAPFLESMRPMMQFAYDSICKNLANVIGQGLLVGASRDYAQTVLRKHLADAKDLLTAEQQTVIRRLGQL
jgi:hypothetical protein